MVVFVLDPLLEKESFFVQDLFLSQCRLMNRQEVVWVILVPRITSAVEWVDLSLEDQQRLLQEINQVSRALRAEFPCDKLNIAALGNIVRQLHVHVIARQKTDRYWPNPVWGREGEILPETEKNVWISRLIASLK